jgi:hypothetical protein
LCGFCGASSTQHQAEHVAASSEHDRKMLQRRHQQLEDALAAESTAAKRHADDLSMLETRESERVEQERALLSDLQRAKAQLHASQDDGLKLRYEFENLRHFESALVQQQAVREAAVVRAALRRQHSRGVRFVVRQL